jgi:hypothetical protein
MDLTTEACPPADNEAYVVGDVPLSTLRSLYLDDGRHNSGSKSSPAPASTVRTEFSLVKKLNPLNKKRILVTGVSAIWSTIAVYETDRAITRAPALLGPTSWIA